MNDVNTITICKKNFETEEAFENAIKKAVMVLLENDYIMTVRWDEKGLGHLSIDFESDDRSFGAHYPYWLSPSEIESVVYDDEERDE